MKKEYVNPTVKVTLVDLEELLQNVKVSPNEGNGIQLGKDDALFEDEQPVAVPQNKSVWEE